MVVHEVGEGLREVQMEVVVVVVGVVVAVGEERQRQV